MQLLNTFAAESDGIPTSVDFVRDEPNKIVASFASANCVIFDAETGKQVVRFEASNDDGVSLNALRVSHCFLFDFLCLLFVFVVVFIRSTSWCVIRRCR